MHASATAADAGCLRVRAERRDQVCVLVVGGELVHGSTAELADAVRRAAVLMEGPPGRILIDLSAVSSIDRDGVGALTAAVRPVPGRCPVVIRSLRPVLRRALRVSDTDLDMIEPDRAAIGLHLPPPGMTADEARGPALRESWRLRMVAESTRAQTRQTVANTREAMAALAVTEDKIAAALLRLAVRRPEVSARLTIMSQAFRAGAAQIRGHAEHAAALEAAALPAARDEYCTATDTLRRAIAFVNDRADEDITVADIAGAAFVSVRAVQMSFRNHVGTTPLGYLRRVRLERAHQDLLAADPARDTVTVVAARWRFANPSRFSTYYRAAYGVPPSHTLRQARAAG